VRALARRRKQWQPLRLNAGRSRERRASFGATRGSAEVIDLHGERLTTELEPGVGEPLRLVPSIKREE
jgi:hypothetical protein